MVFAILQRHWKKSVFASGVLAYSGYSFRSYLMVESYMRDACIEASRYADEFNKNPPKKLLVILNPVANKNKSEKIFKDYCEPILHLAGFHVTSMKTSHVGHAKRYLESVDEMPDVIVVAGGEGTASEVLTGLLRRHRTLCPIAFLPLGRNDSSAFRFRNTDYIKTLTESVLHLLNGELRQENVIKYELLDENMKVLDSSRPIYGRYGFKWGVLTEIDALKDKFWYFGFLRTQAAALFNAFSKKLSWKSIVNVTYTPPCNGCSNCYLPPQSTVNRSTIMKFLHNNDREVNAKYHIKNENCKKVENCTLVTSQLLITACNKDKLCKLVTKSYKPLHPGIDFIRKVVPDRHKFEREIDLTINSRKIQLIPAAHCDEKFYSIDGENYEVRPIQISLMPQMINVFS